MSRLSGYLRQNRWLLVALVAVVPLGFYTKLYSGPWEHWVNNSLGGVFYVIFWSLLLSLLLPEVRRWKVIILIFLITCSLEFMQLWHPPFLERVRSTFLGATLIGNSFVWLDLLHYLLGSLVSVVLLHYLHPFRVS